jgi:hypothetical protein
MPSFLTPLYEANDCHEPAGSPTGGQFCAGPGVRRTGPATHYQLTVDGVRAGRVKQVRILDPTHGGAQTTWHAKTGTAAGRFFQTPQDAEDYLVGQTKTRHGSWRRLPLR